MIIETLCFLAGGAGIAAGIFLGRLTMKPCPEMFRLQVIPNTKVGFKNLPNNLMVLRGEIVDKKSLVPVIFPAIPDGTEVNVVLHHDLKKQLVEAHLYRCSILATLPGKHSNN